MAKAGAFAFRKLWAARAARYARTVEAACLLLFAKFLVRHVQMRHWRTWLGRVSAPRADEALCSLAPTAAMPPAACQAYAAISRACRLMPNAFLCLPRAMAMQWMLARRGCASSLVFGIRSGSAAGTLQDLHAWVEVDGLVVIGWDDFSDETDARYVCSLILIQPASRHDEARHNG